MKIVREHIEHFVRGQDLRKSLSIGKRALIDEWFKTWAPDAEYEIDDNLNININVKGDLDLMGTSITSLPDNLSVGGYLDLENTKITTLPDNLCVTDDLYLYGSKITSLPDSLNVKGKIYKGF